MKIALIHSHLNDRGGSQRYVIEIANNLQLLGVKVDVFCYEYNKNSCYPELTSQLDIKKIYTREENVSQNQVVKKEKSFKCILKKIYKNEMIKKVVNTLGIDYSYSLYSTNKLAKQMSELIINTQNNYDLIFAHEEPLSVYAAIKYKKIKDIPIYWFCYDTIEKWFLEWKDEHKSSSIRKLLLQKIYFKYDKYIINKFVDKSAVLDNNMLKRYQRLYGKTPLVRRGGIPQAILEYNRKNIFKEKYNLSNDIVVIFSLTRFVNYRRVHDILEMYKKLDIDIQKKVFIYLNSPITDKPYYEWCIKNYKEILQNENIKISLEYPQDDDEMYDMYLSSDIFIFPNENQTWGHAPLEAMGCGVATLVSTGCGINEAIKNISPEMVFEVGNTAELTTIIEDMIKNKSYESISQNQKKYVSNNWTWNKVCEKYIDDFKVILENKNV